MSFGFTPELPRVHQQRTFMSRALAARISPLDTVSACLRATSACCRADASRSCDAANASLAVRAISTTACEASADDMVRTGVVGRAKETRVHLLDFGSFAIFSFDSDGTCDDDLDEWHLQGRTREEGTTENDDLTGTRSLLASRLLRGRGPGSGRSCRCLWTCRGAGVLASRRRLGLGSGTFRPLRRCGGRRRGPDGRRRLWGVNIVVSYNRGIRGTTRLTGEDASLALLERQSVVARDLSSSVVDRTGDRCASTRACGVVDDGRYSTLMN